jgi:zinc protease
VNGRSRPSPTERREYHFPSVERLLLGNGLRVLVAPIRRLPLVSVLVLVDAGSASENSSVGGLASLTAQGLAEGTERLDGAALTGQFEDLGTGFDTASGWDETIALLTVTPARLQKAMALLGEVLVTPRFAERDVRRLKEERLAELLQQQMEPRGLADDRFAELLYVPGSRYGLPEGGSEQTVRAIDASELRSFHGRHYAPGTTTMIVVGDVTPEIVLHCAETVFGEWGNGPRSSRSGLSSVDDRQREGGARVHVVDRPRAPQTELRVGHRGLPRAHPDYFPATVMNALLGGLFSSRINLNLRERHAFTYGASSAFDWRRGAGPFEVSTAVRTDVTADAVREILVEIDRMRSETVSASELSLAVDYLDGVFPIRFETTAAVARAIAVAEVYVLGEHYYQQYQQRIRAVTKEEVRRVAEQHLRPNEILVVAVGDASLIEGSLGLLDIGPLNVDAAEREGDTL